jgi:glycosyltransferase involved in cell wall biosynthesis
LGSGVKIKNLIAMGLGVPLVATPESMAGIDVHTGHHCLVAGDAESFASSVIRLLEEEDLRRRLSTGARDWFVRNVASGTSVESWLRFIAEA